MGPELSEEEAASHARTNFDIHSPIDGLVLRVMEESSTIVVPGTSLVELGDPQDLEVVIDVLSTDAVKVKPGTHVYLEHWGGEKPLMGVVRLIEPSAFEKISALGVEEQRVNVIVDLEEDGAAAGLGDGYRVEARIIILEREDVVRVPVSALFRDGNEWAVFEKDGEIARRKRVTLGARNDQHAEVLEGVAAEQQVILHPSDKLADGVAVVNPRLVWQVTKCAMPKERGSQIFKTVSHDHQNAFEISNASFISRSQDSVWDGTAHEAPSHCILLHFCMILNGIGAAIHQGRI